MYLVITPLLIWTMNKIGKPIQELQTKASRSGGKAYSIMSEMLQNNAAIKAFGAEEAMDQRFAGEVESQRQGLDQAARKGTLLTLTAYLSDVVLIAVVFLFGGWLIAVGQITVGAFVTFVTLSGSIREAFSLLDKSMSTLRQAEAYALRIYEVLDLPQEKSQTAPTSPIQKSSGEAVTMEGLSFSYLPGKPVLQGMELHVKPGEHVGVIGPSGCGKTTLLRLICGLYQGYEGDLRVLGRPVSATPLEELRGDIAVVSQEPHLFRGDHRRKRPLRQAGRHRRPGGAGPSERPAVGLCGEPGGGGEHPGRRRRGPGSAGASGNGSPSPGLSSATRGLLSWTKPPPPWTPRPRGRSSAPWTRLSGTRRCWSSLTGLRRWPTWTGSIAWKTAGWWSRAP